MEQSLAMVIGQQQLMNALDADSSSEIPSELIKKIREEAPTSQLTGKVISNLPRRFKIRCKI